jgi:SAM-dependent methyltransferase
MGCGRGRHVRCFVGAGAKVTGIDLSPESINEARELVPEADLRVHDMRYPMAENEFDLVVCLFTSLGYSPRREDDQLAMDAAATALKPGGLFVLDLLNGQLVGRALVGQEHHREENVGFSIQRAMDGRDIVKRITVEDQGTVRCFEERVHAWSASEVVEMVERAGLVIERVTDGPRSLPFDADRSERIVVWARKPPTMENGDSKG